MIIKGPIKTTLFDATTLQFWTECEQFVDNFEQEIPVMELVE